MEALNQAKKLYVKCHDHEDSLSEEDRIQLTSDIQRFITIAIKEITSKNLFANNWMLNILKRALEVCTKENSDVMPVSQAFSSLERYMLNLVEQPWKPEYKKLKMYGGFYKTRIKSVLPEPETIFQKAGYTLIGGNHVMVLKGPVNKNNLLLLAFDCRIAAVECKTISEHYSKLKVVGMNLSDAVSNILHEATTRDVYIPRSHVTSHGNTTMMIQAPPHKGKISYECAYVSDDELDIYNYKPPALKALSDTDHDRRVEAMNPPLLTSDKMYRALPYMDGSSEENIPELPQGTTDDHMRESLKLFDLHAHPKLATSKSAPVSREGKSDDWRLCQQIKESARVSVPTNSEVYNRGQPGGQITSSASNPLSVNTYPPGAVKGKSGLTTSSTDASIDEGIQVDMGSARFTQPSTGFSSLYQQPSVSSNSLNNNKQVSGHPGEYYAQFVNSPARFNTVLPVRSYQDSPIAERIISHPPQDVEQNNRVVPPPIPSRALKPAPFQKVLGPEYVGDTIYCPPTLKSQLLQPHIGRPSQCEVIKTQPDLPKVLPCAPKRSITEPIMRRPGKSNSLKYGDEKSGAAIKVANSRAVRSMDMTLPQWQCQACTTLNLASATVCTTCTHSRHGPHLEQQVLGMTKRTCPYCTLENDPSRSNCECCEKELLKRYTSYV